MYLFHHYHADRLDRVFSSDFWLYEMSVWLHVVGRSLVAIFIPILLLQIGYDIGEVISFYFIYNIFDVPLNLLARYLITKIGAKRVIIIGKIWSIGFFVVLSLLGPGNWFMIVLLALLGALYDSFYWVAHRFIFIESTGQTEDVGKKTGILAAVQKLAGFIGPAVGAAILIFLDRQVLLYASILILALSVLPLLKMRYFSDKLERKPVSAKEFFRDMQERKNFLSASLFAVHAAAENVLWPIFIFLLLESLESIATVAVIVSITAIVFSYFTGHVRKKAREKTIVLGASLIALIWILRIAVESEIFLFVSISLVSVFSLLITVPLTSNIYSYGKKVDSLSASTFMNISQMLPKLILFGILTLLVNVFDVSFVIAAASLIAIIAVNYIYFALSKKKGFSTA